ncbi:MAG: PHP domain-containing protein [Thermodesulfovibrionia bacterium]|nr:PHP domain-containing protein [Thermodesulfovibrionia bacterium]
MALSSLIDLHIHSTHSDGVLKPAELVDLAESQGLSAIAITDHDTVSGTDEAIQRGHEKGIEVISGIEISSWHDETSMHILGYRFRHDDRQFKSRLQLLQHGRETRNVRIIENLNKLGIRVELEELLQYSEYGQTGRPHIARLLVDKGVAKTIDLAFKYYLRRGAAAYAERFRFSAHDAIAMIQEAGGIAVLAHPSSLDPSLRSIPFLLKELCQAGLDGVEVYYPSHSPKAVKALVKMAKDLGLLMTGGSDFHDSERSGNNASEWARKTNIPYDLVATMNAAITINNRVQTD